MGDGWVVAFLDSVEENTFGATLKFLLKKKTLLFHLTHSQKEEEEREG